VVISVSEQSYQMSEGFRKYFHEGRALLRSSKLLNSSTDSPPSMKPEVLLHYSQESESVPYIESVETSPYCDIIFLVKFILIIFHPLG
jgi:hypothetical protein